MTPGILLLALLGGCTGDAGGADTGVCGHEPALTWANFGQGWMDKHCIGCHSSLLRVDQRNDAPVGVDLDTWEDAVTWGERIGARSLGEGATMPPGGGPSEEERRLLSEWLECAVLPAGEAE
ncbi:MAG: hypothetical protein Q8P18_23380 [Pseudomonadota bacterium]|nr:hypothetical protein [Pseudomonadota bacterium]